MTKFLNGAIGEGWISDLHELKRIEAFVDDPGFRREWRFIKRSVKEDFTNHVRWTTGVRIDPQSLFDVQVKRIHEYKRQHLNVLHVIALYLQAKFEPNVDFHPRTFVFGGKAAPGYHFAKLMIRLITAVAEVINKDASLHDRLKVVFLPNYNVTNGQRVYPSADLSEQISTAGKEASGTGNMKFSMNGALTIGTLDGANVEIREEVGAENFFLFGMTAEEVAASWRPGSGYDPMALYRDNEQLRAVIDLISEGHFSRGDRELFRPIIDSLLGRDNYRLMGDFALLRGGASAGQRGLCRQGALDAHVDPERRAHGQVLVRSQHPRLLPRHLARAAGEDRVVVGRRGDRGSAAVATGHRTRYPPGEPSARSPTRVCRTTGAPRGLR